MKSLCIRLTLALAVVIVALIATSQSPPMARGTMMSSQKVALVPNAAGEGSAAGVMPTTGTVGGTSLSFGDFQFSDLAVASVSAGNLAGFDTLVLLQVDTAHFTSQQKADISAFVDGGGKLIIYDSDATNGVDYSWLIYPFSTHPPCPNCGLLGGTLTIVEDNTLSSTDPASPYYINTSEIPPNTDAVGDANVVATSDPNWFGDMEATNARSQTGWTHTYAESPSGKGVLIYNGIDSDYIRSTSWSASGIDWLAKIWYLELKQQWDPTALPGGKPIAGQVLLSPLTASLDTGQTHTLTATVRDQDNNPLSGVSVNFTVTGANPTSGSDVTDAAGEGTLSYVGNNEGRDTIVASATIDTQSITSNIVHADWTAAPGFSFAVITDLHVGRYPEYDNEEYYLTQRLKDTVNWINANAENRDIKFVVVLGDISNDEDARGENHKRELEKAEAILTGLSIPYVPVLGNHDVDKDARRCRLWVRGRCRWWETYATATLFEEVFPDQLAGIRERLPTADVPSDCGTPGQDDPPDLQNFSFTYRGVTFIGLDFVSRVGLGWALGVAHDGSLDCLGNALAHSEQGTPVIILAHHPLLSADEYPQGLCVFNCFQPGDFQRVLDTIRAHGGTEPREIVSFGGHIHGFREGVAGFSWVFNANQDFAPRPAEGIRRVITEALMVGANERDKGFIRIVQVGEDGRISVGAPVSAYYPTDRPAFNPYMECHKSRLDNPRLPRWLPPPSIECEGHEYSTREKEISSWEWDFNGDNIADGGKDQDSDRYFYPSDTRGQSRKVCLTVSGGGADEKICQKW